MITAAEYLDAVFPKDLLLPDEMPVIAHPDNFISRKTGERVDYFRQMRVGAALGVVRPWYFCVSTTRHQRVRQVKKAMDDVRTAFVLACDDIGSKCIEPPVLPSLRLETSAGNYQWHYMIEPFDVSTPKGQAYYDSCLLSLAQSGMNDPGFRSATRLARLPGSLHKTGFRAIGHDWRPDRTWELAELMEEMGVPLITPRLRKASKPGMYLDLIEVTDPVYRWLVGAGLVFGHNDQWVHIECPWREFHTDGAQGQSSTSYSPPEYGISSASFKCLHGHCANRDLAEFYTWANAQMRNK